MPRPRPRVAVLVTPGTTRGCGHDAVRVVETMGHWP